MWLLNVNDLQLEEFQEDSIPPYAILSHTWQHAEVTFHDIRNNMDNPKKIASLEKIKNCCRIAGSHDLQYVWIDTCGIDKSSSAELSEAINSMFRYYQNAKHCYVYLVDVPKAGFDPSPEANDTFRSSRWFKRGWTLQELIASRRCTFYSKDWELLGTKDHPAFREKLSEVTNIPREILANSQNMRFASIAQRMSWASSRSTTRPEDMAYSLMGLFAVNIPILYGEGARKAFKRLQLEIVALIPDRTIFAWRRKRDNDHSGLLADSVEDFADSGSIVASNQWWSGLRPYSMTNVGMSIKLHISTASTDAEFCTAALSSWIRDSNGDAQRVRIYLVKVHDIRMGESRVPGYRRIRCHEFNFACDTDHLGPLEDIFVLEKEQFELVNLMKNNGDRTFARHNDLIATPSSGLDSWTTYRTGIWNRLMFELAPIFGETEVAIRDFDLMRYIDQPFTYSPDWWPRTCEPPSGPMPAAFSEALELLTAMSPATQPTAQPPRNGDAMPQLGLSMSPDKMIDPDPFGLSASMHFPTPFSFDARP
jgi:Heterokaryon incompatibility protein (HET)